MHKEVVEGKNFEDAKNKALEKLNANESEVIIINLEEKKGLFSKSCVNILSILYNGSFTSSSINNFFSRVKKSVPHKDDKVARFEGIKIPSIFSFILY